MDKFRNFINSWLWVILIIYIIVGFFYPVIGTIALVCMLMPSVIALFKGRLWCSKYCPRGNFNDKILSKISLKNKLPAFMKKAWFKILLLVILLSLFAFQIIISWGNIFEVSFVFIRMVLITTIINIILGIRYNHRTWCSVCPMGTLAHYTSKSSIATLNKYKNVYPKSCLSK